MTSQLDTAYEHCRRLNAQHGRTYYLATLLLPARKRPAIHALYAFARWVDDSVDAIGADRTAKERALDDIAGRFARGDTSHPILAAVHDTVARCNVPMHLFDEFFASMRMDLDITEYATWDELATYMRGSAAVIGLQTLPVLEPATGLYDIAATYACDLGVGFQLTNFIRDVGEDLRRGRLYLPREDLDAHGVTRASLESGIVDDATRALLATQIARARALLHTANAGIRLLHPTSRDCVTAASRLYGGILDEIERVDYRVLDRRISVGSARRASVALPAAARAWWARRPHHTHHANVWSTSANPNIRSSTGA